VVCLVIVVQNSMFHQNYISKNLVSAIFRPKFYRKDCSTLVIFHFCEYEKCSWNAQLQKSWDEIFQPESNWVKFLYGFVPILYLYQECEYFWIETKSLIPQKSILSICLIKLCYFLYSNLCNWKFHVNKVSKLHLRFIILHKSDITYNKRISIFLIYFKDFLSNKFNVDYCKPKILEIFHDFAPKQVYFFLYNSGRTPGQKGSSDYTDICPQSALDQTIQQRLTYRRVAWVGRSNCISYN